MRVRVRIDSCGWINALKPGTIAWQSVTSDEMKVQILELRSLFPNVSDLPAVRESFRGVIQSRKGALISCDPVPGAALPTITVISKYPAGRGYAMSYVAAIFTVIDAQLLELFISGSEDNFTGVREAMITHELMGTATPAQMEQFNKGIIPIEWKFERYHPGTRSSELAYLLSDDEKYDVRYPNHPLTRVRRAIRRIERTFQVTRLDAPASIPPPPAPATAEKGGLFSKLRGSFSKPEMTSLNLPPPEPPKDNHIEIETVPLQPMGYEELVRELGPEVANDAMLEAALKKSGIAFPGLETRQKTNRERRDQEFKNIADQFQALQTRLRAVAEAGKKLAAESTAEATILILARERTTGRWHTLAERQAVALALFDNQAFYDDFIESRELACDPEKISLKDLFGRFPELKSQGIQGLTINRCPRCTDPREVLTLDSFSDEPALLLKCATIIAGHRFLVEEKLHESLAESDAAKRRAGFMHILWHMDPGNATAHLEMGKIAVAERDPALFKYSKEKLARYAPDVLSSLPDLPES